MNNTHASYSAAETVKAFVTHTKQKPYQCQHCDKFFTTKSYLAVHLVLHKKYNIQKLHHCEQCVDYGAVSWLVVFKEILE